MNAHVLSHLFQNIEATKVHNLNLVTPSHFAPAILNALALRKPGIPVIWNSSGYETIEMVHNAKGFVDVFLPDFKFATSETAAELAGAADYYKVALSAIQVMCHQNGPPVYNGQGILIRGTLVRHLVLPLRIKESLTILNTIANDLPKGTPVSIMRQYTPIGKSSSPGLNRNLTEREYRRVLDYMRFLEIPGYIQRGSAVNAAFIPAFMDQESTKLFPNAKT